MTRPQSLSYGPVRQRELTHRRRDKPHEYAKVGRRMQRQDPSTFSAARLAASLRRASRPDVALRVALRDIVRSTSSDGGAILLRAAAHAPSATGFRVVAAETSSQSSLASDGTLLSHTVISQVLETGKRCVVTDALESYGTESVVALRLRSVACLPILSGDEVAGAIFLGMRAAGRSYSTELAHDLELSGAMMLPFLEQLETQLAQGDAVDRLLLGSSKAMADARDSIRKVATSSLSVLVLGETGTGKDVVARALHAASNRANKDLIALNCAAVPESLMASELFGVKKGAFTGASVDRRGKLELAHESTLFLDEIGDMPAAMQTALLRALEERAIERLGDNERIPTDFRLVSATHKDIDAAIASGSFRQDLFFRICDVSVFLPPLRDRGEDVLILARAFLDEMSLTGSGEAKRIGDDAASALLEHRWPGNVRELRSVLRRAYALTESETISRADLALAPHRASAPPPARPAASAAAPDVAVHTQTLEEARDQFTRTYVQQAVATAPSREAAAATLGISLRSLYRYLSDE